MLLSKYYVCKKLESQIFLIITILIAFPVKFYILEFCLFQFPCFNLWLHLFQSDFLRHVVNKNQAIRSMGLRWRKSEGNFDKIRFWGPERPLRSFLTMSDIYFYFFIFIHFFFQGNKLFAQLYTDQNQSNLGNGL